MSYVQSVMRSEPRLQSRLKPRDASQVVGCQKHLQIEALLILNSLLAVVHSKTSYNCTV